ncbi:hypothetical protein DI396_03190 [Litorivita pollutaquae]|uniref:Uncharacterized protein n=1 Tax=Litorivita pollutaquae TaxID=2200892 RepID=A0A2V4NVI4_9RHOB|nr:hypothetical protein DI396_03190 [Litorivita pollutaquae]
MSHHGLLNCALPRKTILRLRHGCCTAAGAAPVEVNSPDLDQIFERILLKIINLALNFGGNTPLAG